MGLFPARDITHVEAWGLTQNARAPCMDTWEAEGVAVVPWVTWFPSHSSLKAVSDLGGGGLGGQV